MGKITFPEMAGQYNECRTWTLQGIDLQGRSDIKDFLFCDFFIFKINFLFCATKNSYYA